MVELVEPSEIEQFLTTVAQPGIREAEGDDENEQKNRFILEQSGFEGSSESFDLIDGSGDGGIDVFKDSSESGHVFEVYQLSGPELDGIGKGEAKTPPSNKLTNDIEKLFKGIRREHDNLSDLASRHFLTIQNALEGEDEVQISVRIRTLYRVPEGQKEKVRDCVEREGNNLGRGDKLRCVVDILDVRDFAAKSIGLTTAVATEGKRLHIPLPPGHDFSRHNDAYIFFASPESIVEYYDEAKNSLLHLNLRGYQGNSTPENTDIADSVAHARSAKRFHELNNGLVIVGDVLKPKKESLAKGEEQVTLRVDNPQVVNGGQTLHTLWRCWIERALKTRKTNFFRDVHVPIKLVHLPTSRRAKDDKAKIADQIAKASNTQHSISDRTLKSHHPANRRLRRAMAGLSSAWLLEIADKDWVALQQANDGYLQQQLGIKNLKKTFKRPERTAYRRIDNTKLFEYTLAAYGCLKDAKPSSIWNDNIFPAVVENQLSDKGWKEFWDPRNREPAELFRTFKKKIGLGFAPEKLPSPNFFLLVWVVTKGLFELAYSDSQAARAPRDLWNSLHPGSEETEETWKKRMETDLETEIFQWCEHVLNSMKKALIFETFRILSKRYGPLDDAKAEKILELPQFKDLAEGKQPGDLLDGVDARKAEVGHPETPIYTLLQVFREGCGNVFDQGRRDIREMTSRQQKLMGSAYVERLSIAVDDLTANPALHFGQVTGIGLYESISTLREVLPDLPS